MSSDSLPGDPRRKLAGHIALIFGAGSGGEELSNGQAASLAYARAGATLVAVDRNGDAAETTSRMIRDEGGVAYPLVGQN